MLRPPDWVFVWFWLRFQREPKAESSLPQQADYVDETMSTDRYQRYLAEWEKAGTPKASTEEVLAALGAVNPLMSVASLDDGIPF